MEAPSLLELSPVPLVSDPPARLEFSMGGAAWRMTLPYLEGKLDKVSEEFRGRGTTVTMSLTAEQAVDLYHALDKAVANNGAGHAPTNLRSSRAALRRLLDREFGIHE